MNKINGFIVVATADNISKMTNHEIHLLADLLSSTTNGVVLSNAISFFVQDKQQSKIEAEETVC